MKLYWKVIIATTSTLSLWSLFLIPHLLIIAIGLSFLTSLNAAALVSDVVQEIRKP